MKPKTKFSSCLGITINKKKIGLFCKKHHISSLALFGSVLTARFSDSSDIDVLIKFEKKHVPNLLDFAEMEFELSSIMGRKVDLRTPNDLSEYFRNEVLSKAKIVYAR